MNQPELFIIQDKIVIKSRSIEKLYYQFSNMVCVCGHKSCYHHCQHMRDLSRLEIQFTFTDCFLVKCGCDMFKRDNLLWLEEKVTENR